uniref:WD repeat-containing protein 55 n=2 Tax=Salarias fasciatus TaxID=181472 RepID=A0A672F295_SALFA
MSAPTEHVEAESSDPLPPETSENQNPDGDGDSDQDPDGDEPPGPRVRDTPEDIRLEAVANTVALHPSRDVLVVGDLDGDVYAFSYSCTEGETRELWSSGHHLKSCRQVRFSEDGLQLYSVSRDKAVHLLDTERGQLVSRIRGAHAAPINSLLLVDPNILATGDDEGTLKVWDMRKGTAVMDMKQHEDYISDMTVDQNKRILLTTSGDGTLGVFHLKRRRAELRSEPQSGDLTAVALMKRGRKVVCGSSGSGGGTVYLFNWDGFGAASDRFALRAESVDCMAPVTDSVVCVASTDGYIRAVNILPNRVLGCVGQHVGEPVEALAVCRDARLLVSSAHDQLVRFWDVSALHGTSVSEHRKRKRRDGRMKALSKKAHGEHDFFAGLAEEGEGPGEEGAGPQEEQSDSDSDSDSD